VLRRHMVLSYVVLAYGVTWAIRIPMALMGVRVQQGEAWPTHIPGLFGPLAAALVMSAIAGQGAGVRGLLRRMLRWRVARRWYLVALSPLALYAGAVVVPGVLGQGWPDPAALGRFSGLPVVVFPVMWLLLLVTSCGEEAGWRGFAAEELMKTRSFLSTAVVIGLVWALWHVPSMFVVQNYRDMGIAMLPMFTLGHRRGLDSVDLALSRFRRKCVPRGHPARELQPGGGHRRRRWCAGDRRVSSGDGVGGPHCGHGSA
jgi:membrane protease YdiL (CAAX protease family)